MTSGEFDARLELLISREQEKPGESIGPCRRRIGRQDRRQVPGAVVAVVAPVAVAAADMYSVPVSYTVAYIR